MVNKIAESNDYNQDSVELVDVQSQKDFEDFKNHYEKATEDEKKALNEKFKTYLDEELQKDSELKDRLNGSEIKESSEISEQDIENLNTVRNLTDVLNKYPDISSPEYRAIKKIIEEHIKDLNKTTQEVFANTENKEGDKIDSYNK